ncbi:PREDICTED: probable RNA-binding protein CG14230 [Dufourea novaeangliae]|uniref:probable RNA-binding protein CG14230 n=1 Tax=Dufourea novaeangliae TaxID=178035 RepID=UPI000767B8C0|nr:PREDICTED: probable RNA-binding protein CG14230 [Dufourea novaeangliae]
MNEISESEKKRLESLKQKKETFRAKELAVQEALKNLDSKSNKNKIIFDENVDKLLEPKIKEKTKKRKHNLFDDDADEKDNNESVWDISNFETTKKRHNITLGNDKRFKLDERFMDADYEPEKDSTTENNDETDLQKEKKLQLDILENILGVPIQNISKNKDVNKDPKFANKQMIRYDPTEDNHKEYEIVQKSEVGTKKVKKKKKPKDVTEDNMESTPIEVSKDVYFSVSDSLSQSLKKEGQFSLLKAYGKEETNEKEEQEYSVTNIDPSKSKKFQFNFDTKNPFKYDSSDDENDNKEISTKKEQPRDYVSKETNNFFFDNNDARFNEAVKFFSEQSMSPDNFKNLRQELKQIVRLKIRRNVKKQQPYGRKKKVMKESVARKKKH